MQRLWALLRRGSPGKVEGEALVLRSARGGVRVPGAAASPAPIVLIGVGEGIEDLQPFDARAFARSLVGLTAQPQAA